jgi:hypothetical protein
MKSATLTLELMKDTNLRSRLTASVSLLLRLTLEEQASSSCFCCCWAATAREGRKYSRCATGGRCRLPVGVEGRRGSRSSEGSSGSTGRERGGAGASARWGRAAARGRGTSAWACPPLRAPPPTADLRWCADVRRLPWLKVFLADGPGRLSGQTAHTLQLATKSNARRLPCPQPSSTSARPLRREGGRPIGRSA